MGEVEVAAFLKHVAASTQNQALSARLFFMSSFSSASWAFSTT